MAVDDMRRRGMEPEFREDLLAGCAAVVMEVIGVFVLLPRGGIVDVGALERLDLSAAQGGILSAAQVPHEIETADVVAFAVVGVAGKGVRHIKVGFSAECFAEKFDLA